VPGDEGSRIGPGRAITKLLVVFRVGQKGGREGSRCAQLERAALPCGARVLGRELL